jgi:2',3'-cyclic-nucleotide 2'-phosphodiesterase (5'-nucleotidase family)
MKSTLMRLGTVLMLGIAASAAFIAPAAAEDIKITVVGVGDIYAFDGGAVRGGFTRLNALAKAEKAANPNTLYLHDGDMFSPSLLSGIDSGANTVDLTNVVPFDLAVPGNHEFDFGTKVFGERVAQSKYPWAAINIKSEDGSPIPGLGTETVVKEFQGVKVAIVPISLDETPELSSPTGLVFEPSVASALNAAQQARDAGADVVIALTHTDHDADYALQASHKFDLIVSGHDHDLRMGYDGITAYVETSTEANYIPIVDLNVVLTPAEGDKKRTVTWTPEFRIVDTARVEPDSETVAVVDELKAKLDKELNVEIGTTVNALDSRRAVVRGEESAMGNIITDGMKWATGADIAIYSGGGIRGDKEYPAGAVLTRRDIFTEMPFGNTTTEVEISGKLLLEALENGFSQIEQGSGRFPQVSGLKIDVDATKAPGARVVSVLVNGEPLDPAKNYTVAITNFALGGGDGFVQFAQGKVLIDASSAHLNASDVIDYISDKKTIDTKVEGRITIKK